MSKLFNYSTINVSFNADYKSMTVAIKEEFSYLTQEMLYEFETLASWLTKHIEINCIVLTSEADHFIQGFDPIELKSFDNPKFQKFLNRVEKLIQAFLYLPQTVIADLKRGAKGVGIELALTADIRIMHTEGTIQFTQLSEGLTPSCGAISLGSLLLPTHQLRNWVMSGIAIKANILEQAGFVLQTYDSAYLLISLLESIAHQAPIQRIQAKRTFLESIRPQLATAIRQDQNYAQSGLITMDWKAKLDERAFLNAKDFAHFLQEHGQQDYSEASLA